MKALISGITGQTASFLAEILLDKGYEVHGIIRRSSSFNTQRIDHIFDKLNLHYGDLTDPLSIYSLIDEIRPTEIYHLGAQSHVRVSFDIPLYTVNTIVQGTTNILEAVRRIDTKIKIYNACSSEMFGDVVETPQTEETPFRPQSPYACAKVFAYNQAQVYRKSYDMFICNGILFNHESERRGGTFVTKKIIDYVVKIDSCNGGIEIINQALKEEYGKLQLGNLSAKRDWGYAPEYAEAMYLMLQQDKPDDYVIATNETHSVEEFLANAFSIIDEDWHDYVEINPKYYRPAEVNLLQGDYSKAKEKLGWEPKVTFKELVKIMYERS